MEHFSLVGTLNKNVCLMDGSKSCEISGYLFGRVVKYLEVNNYNLSRDASGCDTVLINTCGVTKAKINDSEGLIKQALQYSDIKRIIIFGCLPKIMDKYSKLERVICVTSKELGEFNNYFEHRIPIEKVSAHIIGENLLTPYQSRVNNEDYYILIGQGCVHNCSYCNIKRAKGDTQSTTIEEVISEIKKGISEGCAEFTLLADDCGSYGRDIGTNLAELIERILALNEGIKVKISTFFPADLIILYPRFKELIKTGRITYINIPLQSGSKKILKLMNRDYDINKVIEIIKDIRKISPDTWLYTHILINFPRETRQDFMKSVKVAPFFDETMFITYSDNPQTLASKIKPKIEREEQETRIKIVKNLLNKNSLMIDKQDVDLSDERKVLPGVVQLSLTNKCQYNCRYCGVKYLNRAINEELSLPQIKEIFNDFKIAGVKCVDLSGGEPTLRKDLFEIIKLGKSYGFEMVLETNGALLNYNYLEDLKKANIDTIFLSLDDYVENNHDKGVGLKGSFQKAVKALNYCKELNLNVHTSIVPKSREYFINGDINRYIKFCLDNGAKKIRILFPSYVGNCSSEKKEFCSKKEELNLLKFIEEKFYDYVYVESALSELKTIISEKEVLCPAKICFCYVLGNGLVTPCPYLPIVFGDIRKESIVEIFSRMQDHPYMKNRGIYCPTRDKKYLQECLGEITKDNPLKYISSLNKVDFNSKCNNNCKDCNLVSKEKSKENLINEIKKIDKRYGSVHLYGGEIFLRRDIFEILDMIPKNVSIVVYTNGRIFTYPHLVKRLKEHNVKAVKIPFFSLDEKKFNEFTKTEDAYRQTVNGIKSLCREGIPVSLYIPDSELTTNIDSLTSLGIVSISSYDLSDLDPLQDSVLCFGKRIKKNKLIWFRK